MYHDFNYEATLASSLRAQWQLDDVLKADQDLDFSRNFMPESLARTAAVTSLNPFEQRILNQISAHQYLSIFGIVEEAILPFVLDHARPQLSGDDWRVRALVNFAGEEAKHIQLFKRYHDAFVRGFPVECEVIGPAEAIGAELLRHDPLAFGLVVCPKIEKCSNRPASVSSSALINGTRFSRLKNGSATSAYAA